MSPAASDSAPRFVVIGAGMSGILSAIKLREAGFDDFVIYEKADRLGGTWRENTYPGIACDVPSHLYSYSFEPNPDWSTVHAARAEIQAYVRACAEKYDLIDRVAFDTCIDSARYDEAAGAWTVTRAGGEQAQHRILVTATGGLTAPRIPRIDGLERFQGVHWHSGAWRHVAVRFGQKVLGRFPFSGIYREESASPATGSSASHAFEQKQLIDRAFAE